MGFNPPPPPASKGGGKRGLFFEEKEIHNPQESCYFGISILLDLGIKHLQSFCNRNERDAFKVIDDRGIYRPTGCITFSQTHCMDSNTTFVFVRNPHNGIDVLFVVYKQCRYGKKKKKYNALPQLVNSFLLQYRCNAM